MLNLMRKKSKRGFALPTAVIVSCFIIIIATTLLGIAASSTQRTSGDTDLRQAYLNAKSALDYAARYYEEANLPDGVIGGSSNEFAEYMVMNDTAGGTTENGAEILDLTQDSRLPDYKTYVYSVYNSDDSKITMTAYAKSSDSLGGHAESTTLSVTYDIGSAGNIVGRKLSTAPANTSSKFSSDDITIHVKQNPNWVGTNNYFVPAIYTWTYYQKNVGKNWSTIKSVNDLTVSQANSVENNSNLLMPAGKWSDTHKGDPFDGPVTKMDAEGNEWYSHTFSPSEKGGTKGMVPWFNLIVSRQGANSGSKADGTQSLELFDVWYFDENDRNIYVEVLDKLLYWKDEHWDGKANLEDRLIAYANAPQTVYYVKLDGITDNSLNPTVTIDGTAYSANYSGYGWWSVRCDNISGSDRVSVGITSTKMTNSVSIASVSSGSANSIVGNSAYIVIEPATDASGNVITNVDGSIQYTGNTFLTEEAASVHMGDEDYVTVYGKVYNRKQSGSPTISYKVETHNSSAAKLALKNAIADADQLYQPDYDPTSWSNFIAVVNNAKEVYNKTTLQSNSVYNAEKTKIDDAKKDLKLKEADATKLQQTYDKALTYAENDYTQESYDALKAVIAQARTLLDSFNADKTSVRQEILDNKAIDLENKISALKEIAPIRDALNNALNNARTVRDNNPGSALINSLNTAISNGENLYNNNSRNEASITKATATLNSLANRIQNAVDTTNLENALKAAQETIDRDGAILVPGTVSNLQNVIDVINNSLTTSILMQSEVDNYELKLQSAVDELLYVPQDDYTDVPAGKKRVWFDIDAAGLGSRGTNYYVYAWYGDGNNGKNNIEFDTLTSTDVNIKAPFKLEKDTISSYYYYDLDDKYTNVIIISGIGNSAVQTVDIAVGDQLTYNLFRINTNRDGKGKYKADSAYLANVYSPVDVPPSWGTTATQYAYVEGSTIKAFNSASATADPLTVKDTTDKYYIKRVAYDSKSKFSLCNGTYKTTDIKLDSAEPVIVMFTDKSNAFNVDSKVYSEFMKLAPKTDVQPISAKGSANVVNMSVQKVDTTAATTYTDAYIPSNPIITVYFKKPSSGWLDKLYATLYQYDDSNNKLNEQTNRFLMTDDGNNYYITIDTRNTNAILIYDANSTKTSIVKLAVDSSTNKYFTAQQISGSGSSWTVSAYTTSAVNIDTTDIPESAFDAKNQPMAFVGGKKRIFSNKADTRGGRNDANGIALNNSRPFGGQWNGNDSGTGRVGITQYSVYYDWYEYKIPAGETDLYSFEIKGLANASSKSSLATKQVHQVWGDVWVALDNTDSGSRLNNVSISTVNPDENVTTTTTRIYVTPISSWISNHGGMKVTMWGTGKQEVALTTSKTYDGRYYVDVPNNMPFLQFTSGDNSQILPMTKLQGGDVVLYDYSAGSGGTPAWITYVPAYMALNREIISASSVANGWYIYDYNVSTHESTNSYYPKKLLNMSKNYTPSETANPSDQQANANELAQWTIAYKNLYNAISNARIFITMDASGNPVWYPENASNTTGATYKFDQIKDLYTKAKEAVNEYASDSASLSKLILLAEELDTLESLLTPITSDSAIIILDDTKGWNNNIWLKYTNSSGTVQNVPVTSKNKDGYPMIYVSIPSGQQITDVQFYSSTRGETSATKNIIKSNEVWVCDNSESGTKAWTANNIENYFSYSIKSYTQSHVGDELVLGETATSDKFILYFTYEVTVKYKPSAGVAERTYTILPGAYLVDMSKYKKYHSGATPAPTNVNIYSTVAEKYFTDIVNQGYVNGAPFSDSLGWTNSGNIVTHASPYNAIDSVNFAASSGNLNGSYTAQNKLVFRWLSTSALRVNNNTSMNAKEFVFASAGGISGGSTIAPKFTLRNNPNGNEGNVRITFLTDTTISYKDTTGANISFIIPQGTYEAVNKGAVNLFDSDWAKNFKGVGSSIGSGSDRYLSNPVYKIN